MAIGGALRAAIRAGRFNVAGRESRRQARALASLNEGGPLGGRTGSPFPFPGPERGFDPARVGGQAFGESSRGAAVVVDSNTGRRVVLPQSFDDFMAGTPMARGPIQAPYEGTRAWNDPFFDGAFGPQAVSAPPPFLGRGTPPPSRSRDVYFDGGEFPIAGRPSPFQLEQNYDMFELDSMFSPFGPAMNNSNFMNTVIPRAFGGSSTGPNFATNAFSDPRPGYMGAPWFPASRGAAPRQTRPFFDDFAQ